jgi:hypothetical protein
MEYRIILESEQRDLISLNIKDIKYKDNETIIKVNNAPIKVTGKMKSFIQKIQAIKAPCWY